MNHKLDKVCAPAQTRRLATRAPAAFTMDLDFVDVPEDLPDAAEEMLANVLPQELMQQVMDLVEQ